jgi:SAM-dependent methyltransferase
MYKGAFKTKKYSGPFKGKRKRRFAKCPNCGALERHRLMMLVLYAVFRNWSPAKGRMLHFAPESFFTNFLRKKFATYETADIAMENVDHKVDIQHIPFESYSFDMIMASHILHYPQDDDLALREINRVLTSDGIAILAVPISRNETLEIENPQTPVRRLHGLDYFDKYKKYFGHVEIYSSKDFDGKYQLFAYMHADDRTDSNDKIFDGKRMIDYIAVCHKKGE